MNEKYVPFPVRKKSHSTGTQKMKYISGFEIVVVFLQQLLENVM